MFLRVQREAEIQYPQVLENAIQYILDVIHMTNTPDTQRHLVLRNLLWLVKAEETSVSKKTAAQTEDTVPMQWVVLHFYFCNFRCTGKGQLTQTTVFHLIGRHIVA